MLIAFSYWWRYNVAEWLFYVLIVYLGRVCMTEVSKRNKELREIIDKIISLNDNLSEHIDIISNADYGI